MLAHLCVRAVPSHVADCQASPGHGSPAQPRFEALVAVLHIQANAIRPTGDAPDRAHHTNITGFEILARPSDIPHGASVHYLTGHVAVSPSRVSPVADDFVTPGLLVRTAPPRWANDLKQALKEHFLSRLPATQIGTLIDIGRRIGPPIAKRSSPEARTDRRRSTTHDLESQAVPDPPCRAADHHSERQI